MAKQKKDTPKTTPPTDGSGAEKPAATNPWRYVGPFAIHIVLQNPKETIMPAGMTQAQIEDFIRRRPERAGWWEKK